MTDPVRAIARRIGRHALPHAEATLGSAHSAPWRSMLFDGGRHRLEMVIRGQDADAAIAAIADDIANDDFTIPGHLIAEIRLASVDRTSEAPMVVIEAMTIRS